MIYLIKFIYFILYVPVKLLSHVRLFATPWTIAHQAPLSMGFSKQEYWSGLPCPPPRDLPNPGIEPRSSALQAGSLPSDPPGKPPGRCGETRILTNISQEYSHFIKYPA